LPKVPTYSPLTLTLSPQAEGIKEIISGNLVDVLGNFPGMDYITTSDNRSLVSHWTCLDSKRVRLVDKRGGEKHILKID
jgi:hypothetical protein